MRVVMAIGDSVRPESLGPVPPTMMVRRRFRSSRYSREHSLFITHGGMNSVNEALFYGVPCWLFLLVMTSRLWRDGWRNWAWVKRSTSAKQLPMSS